MTISFPAQKVLLDDAINRDQVTARRATLLRILSQERFLTREHLMVRVEGILGKSCFGEVAWKDTFYRDIRVVKRALKAAGYQLSYSRSSQHPGYYLRNRPAIGAGLSTVLDGSVSEVDPSQLEIYKQLSFAQRFQQGCSITNLAHQVVGHRNHRRILQYS